MDWLIEFFGPNHFPKYLFVNYFYFIQILSTDILPLETALTSVHNILISFLEFAPNCQNPIFWYGDEQRFLATR